MKKNKEDIVTLISENSKVNELLLNIKRDKERYNKIISLLTIIGNFKDTINFELYDYDIEKEKLTSYCFDINDNMFLIVKNKGENNSNIKIIKITDTSEEEYDIRLMKKAKINEENVNLTKSGNIYDFKYGRLITDDKSFYSLFLRGDVCYQIIMNVEKPISCNLLERINGYEKQPTFVDFLKIIENVLSDTDLIDKKYEIASYEHFERKIYIKNEEKKHKELKLNINNSKVLDNESN